MGELALRGRGGRTPRFGETGELDLRPSYTIDGTVYYYNHAQYSSHSISLDSSSSGGILLRTTKSTGSQSSPSNIFECVGIFLVPGGSYSSSGIGMPEITVFLDYYDNKEVSIPDIPIYSDMTFTTRIGKITLDFAMVEPNETSYADPTYRGIQMTWSYTKQGNASQPMRFNVLVSNVATKGA